jgi:DNA topoisomerase VI subunit B
VTRRGSSEGWREWADWMLGADNGVGVPNEQSPDTVGETSFGSSFDLCSPLQGTVAERALYAYLLAEAGEPF